MLCLFIRPEALRRPRGCWLTTNDKRRFFRNYFRGNPFGHKGLDYITDLDVAVVGDRDAALHAVCHLAGVVLKASQRTNFALEYLYIVAQQADFRVSLDQAIAHATASDPADFRYTEHVQ